MDSYRTDGCDCCSLASVCHLIFSVPRRLAHRDLIQGRLISHTIYCLQMVQSLRFISNLKKSDFFNSVQQFTFIGMEFLTQYNIVRVPLDFRFGIPTLDNKTIFNTDSSFSSNFPFSLGKLSMQQTERF